MKIMKIYKKAKGEKIEEPTQEMIDWYEKRTKKHIELVGKYCNKIAKEFPEFKELEERAKVHDDSKFEEPEETPYVWTTWSYKCKDDGKEFDVPEDIEDKMHEATEHHVLNNSHHPEYHCGKKSGVINKEERDKPPKEQIDATKMPDLDVAEMVADWCGVSEERGNSPKSWADKNVNVRWKFTDEQSDLIYKLIDGVWED